MTTQKVLLSMLEITDLYIKRHSGEPAARVAHRESIRARSARHAFCANLLHRLGVNAKDRSIFQMNGLEIFGIGT